jgi:hypothetical protein
VCEINTLCRVLRAVPLESERSIGRRAFVLIENPVDVIVIRLGVCRIVVMEKTVEASLYVVYMTISRPEVAWSSDVREITLPLVYDVEMEFAGRLAPAVRSESEV